MELKLNCLNDKSISDEVKDYKIVEVMAGIGRHVRTYKKYNPKRIDLVDWND